jgi:type IV pilus assembly protein PilE
MKPMNDQGGSSMGARRVRGFSLIELMTVLVIIGVLAGVAWPSYQDYVRRANRAAAQTFMMAIASRQEQYLLTNRSYAATTAALNLTTPSELSGRYTVTVAVPSATEYTITATPIGNQPVPGKFDALTLSSSGAKTPDTEWKK